MYVRVCTVWKLSVVIGDLSKLALNFFLSPLQCIAFPSSDVERYVAGIVGMADAWYSIWLGIQRRGTGPMVRCPFSLLDGDDLWRA